MTIDLPLLHRADLLARQPGPGEQYRFHFDMSRCIGCKCCVVACNEQNGNPAHIQWRRVGEIEGGIYPDAQRWHLSMGCNHCLEPSCLIGCPVEAFTKDTATGIVDHDPDQCIGCQYCTWNCSYGVPQYNAERGVIGKCDMCHHRLTDGMAPACANACPEQAIGIEIVNIAEWQRNHAAADAPGLPSPAGSLSTTRITLPEITVEALARVDLERLRPEPAHWSLAIMLVLTQLAVGAVALVWLLAVLGHAPTRAAALMPAGVAAVALAAVTLHLGRPAYAWRALKAWRRSWLSREVAALSVFAALAHGYAAAVWTGSGPAALLGGMAAVAGFAGVICSARIYMVPARPAWNLDHTMIEFLLSSMVLGPRLLLALGLAPASGLANETWLVALAILATAAQLATQAAKLRRLRGSPAYEISASGRLLTTILRTHLAARVALSLLAVAALAVHPAAAFGLALAAELVGRYLFFASVVPKRMAAAYLEAKDAA